MASGPNIMENDMLPNSLPISSDDFGRMRELAGYSISRQEAELWAQNDVKFLVYDDTSATENGYDSDDEDGMLQYAMRLSQMTVNEKETDKPNATLAYSKPAKDCSCRDVTPFPKPFHPKKLKLFRPVNPLPICRHYLAISYCWPAEEAVIGGQFGASDRETYQIRDLDGSIRPARAPAWVLRRAIDVARSSGINLIWLDQECLPQPSEDSPEKMKHEQQLGIQAMDIIYSRAAITAGLLHESKIATPAHLDAVHAFQSFEFVRSIAKTELVCKADPKPDIDEPTMHHVLDVISSVASDRWYTRAWVAQEALSAGTSLLLVLSQGEVVRKQSSFSLKDFSPLYTEWNSASQEIFAVSVRNFLTLLDIANELLPISVTPREDRPPTNIRTLHRGIPLINRARERNNHTRELPVGEFQWLLGAEGDTESSAARPVVDAATAMETLITRHCRNVEDRIAIVANMCNFQVRLNTSTIARKCKSLKLALLTLAIANGDYSLLIPETFAIEHEHKPSDLSNGWAWPFNNAWHRIDHQESGYSRLACPLIYSHQEAFSPNGIRVSARLWEVDGQIDMAPIQVKWAERWQEMTRVQLHLAPKNVDGRPDYVRGYIHIRDKTEKDEFFLQQMQLAVNSVEIPGEWPYKTHLTIWPESQDKQLEKDVGDMIFDSLRYLYEKSKEEPESAALGLANSIWHSVRTTVVPLPLLPDEVGEWLYHHDGLIENSYEMLDINRVPDGNMAQLWFLERIMRDGYLWVGRYVKAPKPNNNNPVAKKACEPRPSGLPRPKYKISIAKRQIGRNRTANAFQFLAPGTSPLLQIDSGKRAALAEISYFDEWTDESEEQRGKNLVSTFDVDGPCTVAVPFSGSWEILPRPRNRTMSICWVVEKSRGDSKKSEGSEEIYRVVDKVMGMFEIMYIPRGVYTFT